MSAPLLVGICAVGLACSLLCAQIVRWFLAKRTEVKVQVAHDVLHQKGRTPMEMITITAFNRGTRPVCVRSAGVDMQNGYGGLTGFDSLPEDTLPGVIQPHDSASVHLSLVDLRETGIDTNEPIVGRVQLVSGEIVLSRPTRIEP
jgi:hypothetical protein